MHSVAAPSNGSSDTPNSVAAPLKGEQKVSRTNYEAPIPDAFPKPAAGREEKLERVLKEGWKRGAEIKNAADVDNFYVLLHLRGRARRRP